MEPAYLEFCQPGNAFYSRPLHRGEDFPLVEGALPEEWQRSIDEVWCVRRPESVALPEQGWKIHVTATADTATAILESVAEYCTARGIAFKFLRSPAMLIARNSKYADRGASGKFLTIYPRTNPELERTLRELDARHGGSPGPAVLSDLRWGAGPLSVRYGAFVLHRSADRHGRLVPSIRTPEGDLVPEDRRPGFHPPEWAEIPEFLEPALAARRGGTLQDFPYTVTAALHFSNGGGVYRGTDRDGREVILKEARPHAGLDEAGQTATARLIREAEALQTLAGIDGIPEFVELRQGHEHLFLVRAYSPGTTLGELLRQRNPLINPASPLTNAEFADFVLDVWTRVREIVSQVHARGVVYADLHPGNVLVGPDGALTLIDFESSSDVADDAAQRIGVPGFRAPADCTGPRVDEYALAVLLLTAFLPLAQTMDWDRAQPVRIWEWLRVRFPVPIATGEAAVRTIQEARGAEGQGQASTPNGALLELRRFVLGAADLDNERRTYPGDIQQLLLDDARGFLFGTAGVLWALQSTGEPVPSTHLARFVDAVRDPASLPPGFGMGSAGVALALDVLGETELAGLHRAASLTRVQEEPSLIGGSAGVALSALRGVSQVDLDLIGRHADAAFSRAATARAPGLFHGREGIALLMVRMFEATGERAWLDRADGLVAGFVAEAPGLDPALLASPAVGAALAARALHRHRPTPELRRLIDAVRGSNEHPGLFGAEFLEHVGVLRGRAGLLLAAQALWAGDVVPGAVRRRLDVHRADLWLHAVEGVQGAGMLGDNALRLSLDYATGNAGVMHAIAVGNGDAPGFPFLAAVSS